MLFQTLQYSVSRRRITSCRGAADFRVTHSCCSCGARAPPGPHHRLEGERVKSPQGRTVPHGRFPFPDPTDLSGRPRLRRVGSRLVSRGIPTARRPAIHGGARRRLGGRGGRARRSWKAFAAPTLAAVRSHTQPGSQTAEPPPEGQWSRPRGARGPARDHAKGPRAGVRRMAPRAHRAPFAGVAVARRRPRPRPQQRLARRWTLPPPASSSRRPARPARD